MATELGKAYVQIMPSSKGISGSIQKTLDPEAKSAGKSAGNGIAGSIKKVIVAAGIGKAVSMALTEGGALEQSIGGVETLFKDNASTVIKYANDAYKTVGVSANEYMENVTSFSASLLQSLGGDTEKAADKANMAMVDMGDNANKMGTDMASIQNAYQGFAKQNYTMLDNLKLGYGGTKTEMERLLADATKLSGVEYNIDNLADVYEAVHVVQEELGITGTTALEAEETLAGSLSSMKASFKDLLGNLALGKDIGPALQGLTTTVLTFLQNAMPMLTSIITQIPQIIVSVVAEAGPSLIQSGMQAIAGLLTGIGQALPELIPTAIDAVLTLVSTFIENIPLLVQGGIDLIIGLAEGLINAIPIIMEKVPEIINSIIATVTELVPLIIEAGIGLFTALVEELPTIINNIVAVLPDIIDGVINTIGTLIPLIIDAGIKLLVALVENLPAIIDGIIVAIPIIIDSLLDALVNNIPLIVTAGVQLLTALITNLPKIIWELVKAMPKIIVEMVKALGKGVVAFAKIGLELIKGLWQGIKDAGAWLMDKIKGFVGSVTDGIKKFFGIHSPSKLMADEVGKFLPEGLAIGIEANTKPVSKAMEELGALTVDPARLPALSASGFNYERSANGENSDTPQTINVYSVLDGKIISKATSRIQAQTNFGKYRALGGDGVKAFEYKGISSAAFDMVCKSINRPILPSRRPRTIEIYGKAGIVDYGGGDYGITPITINIAYTGIDSTEFRARSRDISAWLSSDKWEKLIVDDEPDKYYLARITSAIDFETFTSLGHATIVFECQPFSYSGGYYTHSTEEGTLTFHNPGTKQINFRCPQGSKSSIVVTGTWTSFTLALNGEMLEYTEAGSGTVIIDNIEMEVDLDGLNKLSVVEGDIDKFLSIKPGENTIYITGVDLDVTLTVDYIPMWL